MHEVIPTAQPSEADIAFELGLKAGAATTLAMALTYGWDATADSTQRDMQAALSEDEMRILAAAVRLILAQRHAAPDDLSGLGHVDLAPCADVSCRICRRETL